MPDPNEDSPVSALSKSVRRMPTEALNRAKDAGNKVMGAPGAALDVAKGNAKSVVDEVKGSAKQTAEGASDIAHGHVGKGLKRIAGLKKGGVVDKPEYKGDKKDSSADKLGRAFKKMHGGA